MKDSRQSREAVSTFLAAGVAALIANHYLGPVIRRKLKVK